MKKVFDGEVLELTPVGDGGVLGIIVWWTDSSPLMSTRKNKVKT
jgi:hypothetical protein